MIFTVSYNTANNQRKTNNHRTNNYSFWVSREYFWVMQENAPLVLW